MKTTNEKIYLAALKQFSENGYQATTLNDIASELGISKPALYRHFTSKSDLFEKMIDYIENYYQEKINFYKSSQNIESYESFYQLVKHQIDFTTTDQIVIQVRKLLTLQQFQNQHIAQLASKHFIDDLLKQYIEVFQSMVDNNLIDSCDCHFLAMLFTSVITLLIHKIDRQYDEKEEILLSIDDYVKKFIKYLKENRKGGVSC